MSVPVMLDTTSLYRIARWVSTATVFKRIRFELKQTKFEARNKTSYKVPQSRSGWSPTLPRFGGVSW